MTDPMKPNDEILDTEIERADMQVSMAQTAGELNKVYDRIEELIRRAPDNRQVREIAKRLALKAPKLKDSLRRAYGSRPFMDTQADQLGEELRDSAERGDYQRADEVYQEAQAAGLQNDPVIRDRYQRSQEQRQQEQQTGVTPPAIRTKQMRAQSTHRVGEYASAIQLAEEGLELLEQHKSRLSAQKYTQLYEALYDQMEQSQYQMDRKKRIQEGLSLIEAGKWTEARNFYRDVLESFRGDESFERELDKLEDALQTETNLYNEASALRGEPHEIDTMIEIDRRLTNLPSEVSAISAPTARQEQIRAVLDRSRQALKTRLKTKARRNLDLSRTANTPDEKRRLLKEAREDLTALEKLDPADTDTINLLGDVSLELQNTDRAERDRVEEEKETARRAQLYKRLGLAAGVLVLLAALLFAGNTLFSEFQEQQIAGEQTRIAQANATATGIINQTLAAGDVRATEQAIASTQTADDRLAQQFELTVTAAAQATSLALTQIQNTAEAAGTQTAISFANASTQSAATQQAISTEAAIEQTRISRTATTEAQRTLTASAPTSTPLPTATPLYLCRGVVTVTQGVNVRVRPSFNSADVGSIRNGALVDIYDYESDSSQNIDGWYQIVFETEADGSQGGWIAANFVAPRGCPDDFGP